GRLVLLEDLQQELRHAPRRRRVLAPRRRQRPVDHGEERTVDEGVAVDEEQAGSRLGGLLEHAVRVQVRGVVLCLEYTPPTSARAREKRERGTRREDRQPARCTARPPPTTRSDQADRPARWRQRDSGKGCSGKRFIRHHAGRTSGRSGTLPPLRPTRGHNEDAPPTATAAGRWPALVQWPEARSRVRPS